MQNGSKKKSLGPGYSWYTSPNIQAQKNIDWTTEMKIDDEERIKGRGFMKRIKKRWDSEFPEQASFSMHNLRNNVYRFQKEPEIRNLILVRNKNEIDRQKDRMYEDPSNHQVVFEHEYERNSIHNNRGQEVNGLINENDNEQELRIVIRVEDKELENIFNQILHDMEHCTTLELHPRKKLPKLKLTHDIEQSANRKLDEYLHGDKNIPEITDKVYAMGKAIAIKSGILQKQTPSKGNRRERKLKAEMKRLRQQIARTSN